MAGDLGAEYVLALVKGATLIEYGIYYAYNKLDENDPVASQAISNAFWPQLESFAYEVFAPVVTFRTGWIDIRKEAGVASNVKDIVYTRNRINYQATMQHIAHTGVHPNVLSTLQQTYSYASKTKEDVTWYFNENTGTYTYRVGGAAAASDYKKISSGGSWTGGQKKYSNPWSSVTSRPSGTSTSSKA